jgi:5-methylthioadenosine/S-adenosylhomocysteine deaminase
MGNDTPHAETPATQEADHLGHDAGVSADGGISRRHFISSAPGFVAGAIATGTLACAPRATQQQGSDISPDTLRGRPILLKGGCVLSLDPAVGNFETADVLIEGARIVAVQPNLTASAEAVDASNMILMPGFVDTHRHIWLGPLRNILPNGRLTDYGREMNGTARKVYRPEDVYIADLVSALGAINAGVTTLLDWSGISNSPAHSDAAIQGLQESGIRGVYGFGTGVDGPQNQFPQDIHRLRKQYFSSDDQLLTLAMAAAINADHWAVAREAGAPISVHINGTNQLLPLAQSMGPDVTYIHCCNLSEAEWQLIAKTGGNVSIACPIEMEMGHGVPPIQQALDHGIRPSLSVDVESEMPSNFFTQMLSIFTLQRMQILARERAGEKNVPKLLTVREVLEFATIEGARDNRVDRKVGTLTPGKEADVILLRKDAINVMPVNNVYGAIVLGMDTSNVDTVFIRGQVRKWQGRLVGVDLNRIGKLVHQSRDYLVSRAGWPRDPFGEGDLAAR